MDLTKWNNRDFSGLVEYINKSQIECDPPNVKLGKFRGTLYVTGSETGSEKKFAIDNDNVLLRGTVLRNCEEVVGVCVYAGAETKARFKLNSPP